jgi:integrase
MHNHLTEEHARQLREALRGHNLEAILTLALVTGMRRDELLSLKWQDIDLEKRELQVLSSKTKNIYRTVLPEDMIELLKQHRLRQMEARLVAGIAWRDLGLVFLIERDQLLTGFQEILEQAGLPSFTFHELRAFRMRALFEKFRSAKEGRDVE